MVNYKLKQKKRYAEVHFPNSEIMPFFFPFNQATFSVIGSKLTWEAEEAKKLNLFRTQIAYMMDVYSPIAGGRTIGNRTWLLK